MPNNIDDLIDYLQYDDGETSELHYKHLAECLLELKEKIND